MMTDFVKILNSSYISYDKTNLSKKMSLKSILQAGYEKLNMGDNSRVIEQLAAHIEYMQGLKIE